MEFADYKKLKMGTIVSVQHKTVPEWRHDNQFFLCSEDDGIWLRECNIDEAGKYYFHEWDIKIVSPTYALYRELCEAMNYGNPEFLSDSDQKISLQVCDRVVSIVKKYLEDL